MIGKNIKRKNEEKAMNRTKVNDMKRTTVNNFNTKGDFVKSVVYDTNRSVLEEGNTAR